MVKGDYKERQRRNKKGKMVTDKIITSVNQVEYAVGPQLGEGGVAPVFRCRRCSDQKEFVFKEYAPDPALKNIHYGIKKNLKELIENPIQDSRGGALDSFIAPLELVELPVSGGFGYIMELVNTKEFVSYGKKFRKNYPDAYILCELGKNLAHLFEVLHLGKGWCYKDINEGNIYLNPKTGQILIIDCDNISVPKRKTIMGTPCYMAPEVYINSTPDTRTDDHSLAVYFFRMLVWGWPLDGKNTQAYLRNNNTNALDAGPVIYGTDALFALDPNDTRNSIRGLGTDESKMVEFMWDSLAEDIQKCFIKTFCDGLKRRESRTTPTQWYTTFDRVQKNGLVVCPKCKKHNFGSLHNKQKTCIYCDAKLPLLQPVQKAANTNTAASELTRVHFRVKRDIGLPLSVTAERKTELPGSSLHPTLSSDSILKLQYNAKLGVMAAVNQSGFDWIVTDNGQKSTCGAGERVILKEGMILTILRRKLQLTVEKIT